VWILFRTTHSQVHAFTGFTHLHFSLIHLKVTQSTRLVLKNIEQSLERPLAFPFPTAFIMFNQESIDLATKMTSGLPTELILKASAAHPKPEGITFAYGTAGLRTK
jgi:hypothetical protein